jgi:phosphate-selective porin OprO/OprP
MHSCNTNRPALLACVLIAGVPALPGIAEENAPTALDRMWGNTTLYEDDDQPVVQNFSLVGRLQLDAAFFDANRGEYERLTWRRFRFGAKSSVFRQGILHVEADFDLNKTSDPYSRLTDAYFGWSCNESLSLKFGKQSAGFTLDGATSSKELITPERSIVADNLWFTAEYFTGVGGQWTMDCWVLKTGGYSSSSDPEVDASDSGAFGLASLEYNLPEATGLDTSLVRTDYVYSDPDYSGDVGTPDLQQVFSLVIQLEKAQTGIWADLSFGDGLEGQSDLWGLQLMPLYNLNERWQLVFRYAMVCSDHGRGLHLSRYPRKIESERAEEAHDFFAGLNWYLYGHKLKWQNGVEYNIASNISDAGDDYDGWGFTSGLRASW